MEAARNPDYLRKLATATQQFREAFDRFMSLHVFNENLARGIAPAVFAKDNADPAEIERAASEVSQAAGRAGAVTGLTGVLINVSGFGTVDPVAAWHTITRPKPVLELQDGCVNSTWPHRGGLSWPHPLVDVLGPQLAGRVLFHPPPLGAVDRRVAGSGGCRTAGCCRGAGW